ncbi:hypothetical protein [Micromonospora purpureochromogenes]|uniref:HEAT repeat-containing protein n=1 Tax=Micromonospora purpureochromogenes TaxID=47872 RepID=A0ABX2RU42_9ACTN|nr:hypothetical protein [Micromonospora purpureochromogenes]NYF58842.1 hypothetical protein [Micromonospora purpureochromogenes]
MSDGDEHGWHYAPSGTLAGALQRGLGRGAHRAMVDPAAPDLVRDCLRRDRRFWWVVDERAVYLARLVRDLALPLEPILRDWYDSPDDERDDDNAFTATLEVLDVLGRAGVEEAVEGVRRYVREGPRWNEALTQVARTWPESWWDDLYPAVMRRPDALEQAREWRRCPPWRAWAERDPRIADAVRDDGPRRPHRPGRDEPSAVLLEILRDRDRSTQWRMVLRELGFRPPEPALLDMAEELAAAGLAGPLRRPLLAVGPPALPAARAWVRADAHPLTWPALQLLAAHGDAGDVPALLSGLDWLDTHDDRCGYDQLVEGLARIGGAQAREVLPRLRRLWFSPHSYERAAYLRAHAALDPTGVQRRFAEGLWDCEADVRLLSARRVALDGTAPERLRYLRDDPIETAEVRAAAAERLDR